MPKEKDCKLKLVAMGVPAEINLQKGSPLLKYRDAVSLDEETGEQYQVGIALRMDGRVEVYFNFSLVDSFLDANN